MRKIIEIENLFYSSYEKRIENFLLREAQYPTIFHFPKFLRYHLQSKHPIQGYKFHDYIVESSGTVECFLPGGWDTATSTFESHKGASFAGPLFNNALNLDQKQEVFALLISHIRDQNASEIIIKATPYFCRQPGIMPSNELEWILYAAGFECVAIDLNVLLNLSLFSKEEPNAFYNRNTKRNLNKNVNVFTIEIDQKPNRFYNVLLKSRIKYNARPTHDLNDLEYIQRELPGAFTVITLSHQGQVIAGAGLLAVNGQNVNTFYICHLEEFEELKPVPHLVDAIIKWALEKGYKVLDFGPSNFGKEVKTSLLNFKLGFGGMLGTRNVYRLKFN